MSFLEKQWKLIAGALAALIIVGAAVAIQSTMKVASEKRQQEAFFGVEKKFSDYKNKKNKDAQPDKKAAVPATPAELATDLATVKKELESFISANPGSKASQMAALYYSEILRDEKSNDLALATLQKVQNNDPGLVNTLVQQEIGQILADSNKCTEAIDLWQKIVNRKEAAFIHNEVKIQQALCYQKMNDLKKAEELLTNIANQKSEGGPEAASVKVAARYLRWIQFRRVSGT